MKKTYILIPAAGLCLLLALLLPMGQNASVGWVKALRQGADAAAVAADVTEKYSPKATGSEAWTAPGLAALCTSGEARTVNGRVYTDLHPKDLPALLPECETLREVSLIGSILYISYITKDAQEIILSYNGSGFNDCCIYDPATDTALAFTADTQQVCKNLRQGEDADSFFSRRMGKYEGLRRGNL